MSSLSRENASIDIMDQKRSRETEESLDAPPTAKKPKWVGLYKPPTHDELQELKETQSLYRTNLTKLQINGLLEEIRMTNKMCDAVDVSLHKLKDYLTKMSPSSKTKLSESMDLLPSSVRYPLSFLPPPDIKGHFQFCPPANIKLIGSHLLRSCLRRDANVDMTLQIPQIVIQEKDFMNYRYFHKRALYLCMIAGGLKKKKKQLMISSVKFSHHLMNPLLPILIVTLKDVPKCSVRIHTCVDGGAFPILKLHPSRNNVRWNTSPHLLTGERSSPPTPVYNNLLLMEMGSYHRHLEEIFEVSMECPSVSEAILLCKTWLRQRELDKVYGSFTGFHCSMIYCYMYHHRMINKSMSNYQLFRMFLQFVATSDWNDCPLTLADRNTYPSLPPIDDFKAHYSVVFLDSSGYLNVTWNMTSQQYQMVKREAAISHAFLDGGDDGFQYVFLKPVTSQLKYDSLCKFALHLDDVKESPLLVRGGLEGVWLDNGGWVWPKIIEEIEKIVIEGFDGRVQSVVHCIHGNSEWKLGEAPPTLSDCHVTFYFLFNPNTFDPLILGPPANTPQASSFRHFWGECSELRKYADGSIHEAVLWTGEGEEQKRTVPQQIINHLLKRHVGVVNDVIMSHRILDSILSVNGSTGEELSVKVVKCYIELSRQLRQLKGLPLAVATVQGASPVFSHSEVTPPPPWSGRLASKYRLFTKDNACSKQCMYPSCKVGVAPYIPHLQVLIHMESSGKWPDDPSALSDMKTLFYMEMAKSISKQYQLISVPSIDHLDVLKEGYVFRISIVHPHEVSYSSIVRSTLLTSTISGYCNQFPTYSLGVRLCKKWVWSHLLANHIPEEVIELMVVHLFLSPSPYTPPGSALCILVRFLDLLKSHDWSCDPLIVNLGDELSDDKIKDIKESFTRDRHNHPLMFIATPLDHTSQLTKGTPTPPVLHRLITLAHKSLDLLTNQIDSLHLNIPPDFEQIFRTPMDHYDVLIHLKHKFVAKTLACEDHAPPIDPTHLPVVGFDPAHSYLKALEAAFSDYALFFYDKCGGHVIAVVWKPTAFEPRPFKVHGVHACTTHKREGKKTYIVPNKETLMKDFLILGEGLVDKIDSL